MASQAQIVAGRHLRQKVAARVLGSESSVLRFKTLQTWIVQNEANLARWRELQVSSAVFQAGPIMQNKPNLLVRLWKQKPYDEEANDARRSQLGARGVPARARRSTGILPVIPNHGWDAHATKTSYGVTANGAPCKTNPICS